MFIKKPIFILLALVLLAGACTPQSGPMTAPASTDAPKVENKTLVVMAAAGLTESFGEIGKAFEAKHAGVKVQFNFNNAQQLSQQLNNGSPGDVFASANQKYMDAVIENGRIDQSAPKIFANNRLVVIYPAANPAQLSELKDLAKPGIKLVLGAEAIPVGQYSLEFLDKAARDESFGAAYQQDVLKNVVSYENTVKGVLTKVVLGEVDAGIVFYNEVSQDAASKVGKIEIPDALNVIAVYPIAALKDSQNPDLAGAFVEMVMSREGQDILSKYGFIPVLK